MTTMYDSIDANSLPDDTQLCAGYINGKYQSYYGMVTRFGVSKVRSITTSAHNPDGSYVVADILDVENGDASPIEAPDWAISMRELDRDPTCYCSRLGTWPNTQKIFSLRGLSAPNYWIADYTHSPHLVPGSVATQWTDAGPYDISITNDSWPLSTVNPIPSPTLIPPYQVGDWTMNPVSINTDKNGNGWLLTTLPWATFQAATIQGSDPSPDADNAYWPGVAKVQNRNGMVLVSVVGSLPLSTIDVFVATA